MFLAVLASALLAPLAAAVYAQIISANGAPSASLVRWQDFFAVDLPGDWADRGAWLVGADRFWISGQISAAHGALGQDCQSCHQQPFRQVADSACLDCHASIQQHINPELSSSSALASMPCQRCHKEYNGLSAVVLDDQAFYVSCHGQIGSHEPKANARDVSDFATEHPEFRPTVVVDAVNGETRRMPLPPRAHIKEMSNLNFKHAIHLAPTGVLHPEKGREFKLTCGDYHEPEPGGGMLPVRMVEHCQMCHRLNFDQAAPTVICLTASQPR